MESSHDVHTNLSDGFVCVPEVVLVSVLRRVKNSWTRGLGDRDKIEVFKTRVREEICATSRGGRTSSASCAFIMLRGSPGDDAVAQEVLGNDQLGSPWQHSLITELHWKPVTPFILWSVTCSILISNSGGPIIFHPRILQWITQWQSSNGLATNCTLKIISEWQIRVLGVSDSCSTLSWACKLFYSLLKKHRHLWSVTLLLYLRQTSACSCKSNLLIFLLLVQMDIYNMHILLLLMIFLLIQSTLLFEISSLFLDRFTRTSYFVQKILLKMILVIRNTVNFFSFHPY